MLDAAARCTWFVRKWAALPQESRDGYDARVSAASTPHGARRRAGIVTRRCYTGRPWANRFRRWT